MIPWDGVKHGASRGVGGGRAGGRAAGSIPPCDHDGGGIVMRWRGSVGVRCRVMERGVRARARARVGAISARTGVDGDADHEGEEEGEGAEGDGEEHGDGHRPPRVLDLAPRVRLHRSSCNIT